MIKKYFLILYIISLISYQYELSSKYIELQGFIFGTYYKIKYLGVNNFNKEINNIFLKINNYFSINLDNSDISRINKGIKNVIINKHFKYLLNESKKINKITNGAFDPTLGIISLNWGFNNLNKLNFYKNNIKIDKIKKYVGLNKVSIKYNKINIPKGFFLDFNGIAKGYTIDLISKFLDKKNIKNYLIEIGGEIRVKGKNKKNQIWKIGIENPLVNGKNSLIKILLKNKSIATSGSYRNFIIKKRKYSHIINYITKNPINTKNLYSVSVITDKCAISDAYATSFMAIGIEKSKKIIKKHPEIKINVVFIYKNNKNIKYLFL